MIQQNSFVFSAIWIVIPPTQSVPDGFMRFVTPERSRGAVITCPDFSGTCPDLSGACLANGRRICRKKQIHLYTFHLAKKIVETQ